ncbi:MAG: preprotein translocase subunit YajC [Varibaculum sp.]|nr:preprotein translocase subunit YajC [Varibaculum sp.]
MDPLVLLVLFVVLIFFMIWSSRNAKKKMQLQQEEMRAGLVPGAWVMTRSGYYGRFVELDGDVLVLENTDGTETLWSQQALLRTLEELPFAPEEFENQASDEAAEDGSNETPAGNTDSQNTVTDTETVGEDIEEDTAGEQPHKR